MTERTTHAVPAGTAKEQTNGREWLAGSGIRPDTDLATPEKQHLAEIADYVTDARDEIVREYTDRLSADDRVEHRLEDSEYTLALVEERLRAFLRDLGDGSDADLDRPKRVVFGRECAEVGLPLPTVLGAFDAYTTVLEPRLTADLEEVVSTEAARADRSMPAELTAGMARLRFLTHLTTMEMRAVADGYTRATSVDGIDPETLIERIETVENKHLRPVEASATVVERASDDVCDLVAEQTQRTSEVSDGIATMSATVEEIASNTTQVETVATDARERARDGRAAATDAIDVMEDIEAAAQSVTDDIRTLDDRVADIDEVVDVIDEIADQTNILALNASFVAARAGQAGEGFAVVADEIKGLAEQSQEQAGEIETMVAEIQTVTERTVENLHETNEQVLDGVEEVEQTMAELDEIVDAVSEAARGVSEIATATDEQAERTEEVAATIDEIAARAEDVQSEIDRIAAANNEQAAKLSELAEAIAGLETLGDQERGDE
jgi:heme-based aerotactic transducer